MCTAKGMQLKGALGWPWLCSGEAMSHGLVSKAMVSELFLVVALTMALTPLLAEIGQRLGKAFEKSDVKVGPLPGARASGLP